MAIRVSASGGRRAPQPQHANRPVGRPKTKTSALVPAAARVTRGDETLSHKEQTLSAEAIETFAAMVGGRDGLVEALAVASDAPEVERIVNTLLDPRFGSWSLRRVCNLVGITVADLFTAYRKAMIVRSHLQATHIIAGRLPPIVDDVMRRATPKRRRCPDCKANPTRGQAVDGSPCETCDGTGMVLTEPDLDRQKLALELGQLTQKGGQSIYVQQNTQVATAGSLATQGTGALEQLHQAVGSLLFTPDRHRDVIEAEVAVSQPELSAEPPAPTPDS